MSDSSSGSAAEWKDHFSHASDDYRRWRPGYPPAMFGWLASIAPSRSLAWDCATGNGQAAIELAACFDRVLATDASAAQIAEAEARPNVEYRVAPAEQSPLGDASADLVTVAQALHWFDVDRFHAEVRRVLRPGGIVAEWGYGLALIEPAIDAALLSFSAVTVGPYWPPERALVEAAYVDLAFPFTPIEAPAFAMTATWDLDRFVAYVGTWSAVAGYRRALGRDPLPELRAELAPLWGDARREIRWPLVLRTGRA